MQGQTLLKYSELVDYEWLHSRSEAEYLGHLTDLAFTLKALYPNEQVYNPFSRLEAGAIEQMEASSKEHRLLYQLLVEGLTKLHHPYRMREKELLITDKEDVILALRLLQPQIWPQTLLSQASKEVYRALIEAFYPNDYGFRQAMMKLRMAKSTLQRHIVVLEKCGYIERVGGNRKAGYLYNVGPRPLWKSELIYTIISLSLWK